ncbi:MAG TPA: cyclophilin-like fold protein [Candidatus Bathyarchaeia archaeon]|nr:cyclophilin-like fold protein [Candidatus Bathyarchaeia archaeon]
MIHKVIIDLPNLRKISLELDDNIAPKTVRSFLDSLPLKVGMNIWGEELYTDETLIKVGPENSKALVELMDVAYWPPGKAICLFFGPTPIGKSDEIRPYSEVNVIGKIVDRDKRFLKNVSNGLQVKFELLK